MLLECTYEGVYSFKEIFFFLLELQKLEGGGGGNGVRDVPGGLIYIQKKSVTLFLLSFPQSLSP